MVPCFCFRFAECDLINFCELSQCRTPDPGAVPLPVARDCWWPLAATWEKKWDFLGIILKLELSSPLGPDCMDVVVMIMFSSKSPALNPLISVLLKCFSWKVTNTDRHIVGVGGSAAFRVSPCGWSQSPLRKISVKLFALWLGCTRV